MVFWLMGLSWLGVGCAFQSTDTSSNGQTVRLGAIFSQSGRYAFVGAPGSQVLTALNRSSRVKFDIHDSAGDKLRALQLYEEMARDETCLAVVGPATTDETLAIIEVADRYKLPCLSISASDRTQPRSPWVFRLPITTYHMVFQIGDYLARKNLTRVSMVSVDSSFGRAGRREFLTQASDFQLHLVGDVISPDRRLTATESDALIARALQPKPQALLLWWSAAGAAELTLAARRQKVAIPILHSGGIAGPEFLDMAGEAAEGVFFPGSPLLVPESLGEEHRQRPPIDQFIQFCASQRLPVSNFGGYAWDGAQLLLEALEEVGPHRAKIRAYLENLQDRPAVSGIYHFTPRDHNGLTHESFLMLQVRQGRWQPASLP